VEHIVKRVVLSWWRIVPFWLMWVLTLAGCQRSDPFSDNFLQLYATPNPAHANFFECHGYGCTFVSRVALSDAEWQSVRIIFTPPAATAKEERRQIDAALVRLRLLVGAHTGTSVHQFTRANYRILGNPQLDPSQLDCIDEAVNTWTYLTMMAEDGLLRMHRVERLAYAGGLPDFDFDQRNTAVIQEIANGRFFAIDPTLVDVGEPPPIFPLAVWLGHWPPPMPATDDMN
jgi:hypothetical protein